VPENDGGGLGENLSVKNHWEGCFLRDDDDGGDGDWDGPVGSYPALPGIGG